MNNKEKGAEALQEFLDYLTEGTVEIQTSFWAEDETNPDVVTHQFLIINSGEATVQSAPEPLTIPLRPVGGTEIEGITIN